MASWLSLPPFLSAALSLKIVVSEVEILLPFLSFPFFVFCTRLAVLFE